MLFSPCHETSPSTYGISYRFENIPATDPESWWKVLGDRVAMASLSLLVGHGYVRRMNKSLDTAHVRRKGNHTITGMADTSDSNHCAIEHMCQARSHPCQVLLHTSPYYTYKPSWRSSKWFPCHGSVHSSMGRQTDHAHLSWMDILAMSVQKGRVSCISPWWENLNAG